MSPEDKKKGRTHVGDVRVFFKENPLPVVYKIKAKKIENKLESIDFSLTNSTNGENG